MLSNYWKTEVRKSFVIGNTVMDDITFTNTNNNSEPEYGWQIQQNNVTERTSYLLKTSLWTDCKFIVGTGELKTEFPAHKLILAMASPVFGAMFHNGFSESNNIIIVDIQPEVFDLMLKFVYCDQIDLPSFDLACWLGYAADKYMLPKLFKYCADYIWDGINTSNVCRGYEFARVFDQRELMGMCIEVICDYTSEIICEASFCEVALSTVEMILDQESLAIDSEVELFNAIETWTTAQSSKLDHASQECKDKQKTDTDELVKKIRYVDMYPQEFADGPARSLLLTKDQSFSILMHLNSGKNKYPLPPGFSTSKRGPNYIEKPYAPLELKNPATYDLSSCWISLSSNQNVKIWGFQFENESSKEHQRGICDESLTLTVMDYTTRETKSVTIEFELEFCGLSDARSKVPFRMLSGRTYKLSIKLQKPYLFRAGSASKQELLHEDVVFNISNCSEKVFISGIIFSTC